ncbi:MAG: protein phosphatase 2C domain-containing protein [Jaaginema sp. PMC 1079.18]|nr:protein phosphatase 2C domain-containing protein [Jaaginema sp. PMC 1080.18]MEC4849716.1 protein phosphatase 2C domain-containing protein [Jaaginema sp. PMC 1079.18]MEC4864855.1 protein phosphatase 2C domain-containing protein [Jaaginema sp. PMC 1078.18]
MSSSQSQSQPFLWAAHPQVQGQSFRGLIRDRFTVLAPQIWQDTQSDRPLNSQATIPEMAIPYLQLYAHSLHVPQVYGTVEVDGTEVLLLENVPIDRSGTLYPALGEVWEQGSPTRQIYWLWQILQLWVPLAEVGVAASLLVPENLRVEGWRIWLRELYRDRALPSIPKATLPKLGESWQDLGQRAKVEVSALIAEIIAGLHTEGVALKTIANALNEILLAQASRQPLRIQVAGRSDPGRLQQHNEDSCYPQRGDLGITEIQTLDALSSHLLLVCDGIGGHEGGEIASQLAVQSLKLQMRSLLAETARESEVLTPDLVTEQLAAAIRVTNNAIVYRNDQQGRESRRRMATTLVMALQLPQQVSAANAEGVGNSHELYLAAVGDSRAYWITQHYCQQLTVDDDIASRETRAGRSFYRVARQHPEAGALAQALGTRPAELLRPAVQRLIIEEDGVLLLCSDGLSDNRVLERFWPSVIPDVLRGKIPLETALERLVEQANEHNGRDNISVVGAMYGVSPQQPVWVNLAELPQQQREAAIASRNGQALSTDLDTPEALSPEIEPSVPETATTASSSRLSWVWGVAIVLVALSAIAAVAILRSQISLQETPPAEVQN